VIFRDLEGTKLVSSRHDPLLAGLAPGIARGLAHDARRGWDRVAYCLLVNHLAEIAAAIADRRAAGPQTGFEQGLWAQARQVLTEAAAEHAWPPQLRAVLAGVLLRPARRDPAGIQPRRRHGGGLQSAGLGIRLGLLRAPWPRPGVTGEAVTITGQLCTPKDVLARRAMVTRLRVGDLVAFGLAGAYAWNISHHGFLMHPPPAFVYL
jgi:hypothetical protein